MASWRSPVSLDAPALAALLRESLDALGYRHTRRQGERMPGETVSLDPTQRGAPAWRFFVETPASFVVEAYDTRPRRPARLAILEVHGFRDEDEPLVRRVLRRVADDAPRAPWRFTLDQRMRIGPFHPAYREARSAWRAIQRDEPIAPGAAAR